jgi:hypothetical protein
MSKEKEQKTMYLHDTHTIWAQDGELHLMSENNYLVINIRNLYFDLDNIIYLTKKEFNKQVKQQNKRIKKES